MSGSGSIRARSGRQVRKGRLWKAILIIIMDKLDVVVSGDGYADDSALVLFKRERERKLSSRIRLVFH